MNRLNQIKTGILAGIVTAWIGHSNAASVTGSVAWNNPTGKATTSMSYGLNLFSGSTTEHIGSATYRANVAAMKPGIVRYHRADLLADAGSNPVGWVNNAGSSIYSWNVARINTVLSGQFANAPIRMINIPNWPAYMDDGTGKLQTSMYSAYATFCADLVSLVNITQGHAVQYWEVTNEKDDTYDANMAALATIYNQARDAMKARDASIKVGGPSFARPDLTARVSTFIANAHAKLDFVSYHTYSSGNTADSNAQIWNSAAGLGGHTTDFKNIIATYTTRAIETHHNEYNISWNPPDGRMNDITGAIFDSLAMVSIAKAGATASAAWNEADGWYGKLEGWDPYWRRPASYVYEIFNTDMGGEIVADTLSDTSKAGMMAVMGGAWKKLALINRSGVDQTIQLSFSGWNSTPATTDSFTVKRVYSWGLAYESVTYGTLTSSAGYTLPANTVSVLVIQEASGPAPGTGTGLLGEYFENNNFTTLKTTRTDPTVNFDFASGTPSGTAITGSDTFSIRWTGQVQPLYSGTYTFYTTTDDGVRLWVNNVQLINKWVNQAPTEWSGNISLTAGTKYDIRMEYYENTGGAVARLSWSSASQAKQIIPQTQLYPGVTYTKITGTAFGTAPWATGSEFGKAYDNNTSTFFDAAVGNGGYAGLDAGSAKVVKRIRYFPRGGFADRMVNGKFQGSNTSSSSGYVDLHTIATMPPDAWVQVDITNTTGYRWIRYLGPNGGYCNIAEGEFYTSP